MSWLRIGRLEIYKVTSCEYIKGACGCRLLSTGFLGFTWLGTECRETQGSELITYHRHEDE